MTRSKQIKMLDALVASRGDELKLVLYDYWKNEIEDNPDDPHHCSEQFPPQTRYLYATYTIMGSNPTYNERYQKNIYKKMTLSDVVESWKDETSYLATNYKSSADFRTFYDMLSNEHAYCVEINLPESEKLYEENYMANHPDCESYDEAVEAQIQKNHKQYRAMVNKYKSYKPFLRRLFA